MLHFVVLTIFPDIFPGPLEHSIAGKKQSKLWQLTTVNIRDYAKDKHKTIDDRPFGGGAGMVIRPDILGEAIEDLNRQYNFDLMIYFTPKGEVIKQDVCQHIVSQNQTILLICGRYEGIDQRILEEFKIIEYSLGDFVLSGGEIAAIALMDACIRLVSGVIGSQDVHEEESFGLSNEYTNLLEYPHYTRPEVWKNRKVPEVLLSGNHEKIRKWRLHQAQQITKTRRPDLLT